MWDQRYSESGFAYGTLPNDFLVSQFKRIPEGGRVLCLAEGEGRNAVFLAQQGYAVTAIDQSAVGLRKAEELAAKHEVTIITIVADAARYDLGVSCWDGIVSIAAHMPPNIRQTIHKQIPAALTEDGVFILEAYTERQLEMEGIGGPPPAHKDFFMSLGQLLEELNGLDIRLGQEIERYISEGKYHQGQSAVVQLVGCR